MIVVCQQQLPFTPAATITFARNLRPTFLRLDEELTENTQTRINNIPQRIGKATTSVLVSKVGCASSLPLGVHQFVKIHPQAKPHLDSEQSRKLSSLVHSATRGTWVHTTPRTKKNRRASSHLVSLRPGTKHPHLREAWPTQHQTPRINLGLGPGRCLDCRGKKTMRFKPPSWLSTVQAGIQRSESCFKMDRLETRRSDEGSRCASSRLDTEPGGKRTKGTIHDNSRKANTKAPSALPLLLSPKTKIQPRCGVTVVTAGYKPTKNAKNIMKTNPHPLNINMSISDDTDLRRTAREREREREITTCSC